MHDVLVIIRAWNEINLTPSGTDKASEYNIHNLIFIVLKKFMANNIITMLEFLFSLFPLVPLLTNTLLYICYLFNNDYEWTT